ncbi:hypothetical protein ACIQ6V_27190 [Streptomyces sp. NPDC096198]|uniref:hypothetical protein n=1 Tax=Streptomyces sp. NPDC096198 TaxID=3366080 RepID=UPI00381B2964
MLVQAYRVRGLVTGWYEAAAGGSLTMVAGAPELPDPAARYDDAPAVVSFGGDLRSAVRRAGVSGYSDLLVRAAALAHTCWLLAIGRGPGGCLRGRAQDVSTAAFAAGHPGRRHLLSLTLGHPGPEPVRHGTLRRRTADVTGTAPGKTAAAPDEKAHFAGTHRTCPPAETWARIAPLLPAAGVTRIADVTWLDDIGIPVYQAISPANHYLSVYQGKGLDRISVKVSAAMEAIERWHGANLDTRPDHIGTAGEVEPQLGYRLDELALRPRHCLNPATRLAWRSAVRLDDGGRSLVRRSATECIAGSTRTRTSTRTVSASCVPGSPTTRRPAATGSIS